MPETTPGTTQSSAVAADWALDPADAGACERRPAPCAPAGTTRSTTPSGGPGPGRLGRPSDPVAPWGAPVSKAVRPARHIGDRRPARRSGGPARDTVRTRLGPAPGHRLGRGAHHGGLRLGEPLAYRAEKSGALVQDVVPVPGQENFHGNARSVPLSFHTENGFHPHPPDYVIFLCLRADHDRIARHARRRHPPALPLLTPAGRQALFAPEFITTPPPSFGPDAAASEPDVKPRPVLSGAVEDPDIRMAQLVTTPLTPRAAAALTEFGRACEATARTLRLTPGDLVIIDNRVTVARPHRLPPPLRRSRSPAATHLPSPPTCAAPRDHRPHDGHMLAR